MLDANHENHLQVWLVVEHGKQFVERIKKGGLPLNAAFTSEDAGCNLNGLEQDRRTSDLAY